VFENELAKLDAAGTLAAAEDNEHALITPKPAASTSPLTGPTSIPETPSRRVGCPVANVRYS
jgi:hypothetical protein